MNCIKPFKCSLIVLFFDHFIESLRMSRWTSMFAIWDAGQQWCAVQQVIGAAVAEWLLFPIAVPASGVGSHEFKPRQGHGGHVVGRLGTSSPVSASFATLLIRRNQLYIYVYVHVYLQQVIWVDLNYFVSMDGPNVNHKIYGSLLPIDIQHPTVTASFIFGRP